MLITCEGADLHFPTASLWKLRVVIDDVIVRVIILRVMHLVEDLSERGFGKFNDDTILYSDLQNFKVSLTYSRTQ